MAPSVIAGRYRVERAVGQGGMGTVWLCTDEVLGRQVAVKQVGHLPGESTPDLARALREARSAAALNHPHVVSIHDVIEQDDDIWLVMEYVPGQSLSEMLKSETRLDPARVARIGAQVADGLSSAHLKGTTHRDVKPGNILVAENDHAKISDFGIARTMGDSQLTRTGMVTGTPDYFSPQLARGQDPSPADDVWALGATLFRATDGRTPYRSQANALALLAEIASTDPPRPERAGELTDLIVGMMAPDPADRLSMADAAFHLREIVEGQQVTGTQERVALPAATEPDPDPTPTVEEPAAPPATASAPAPAPDAAPGRRRRWPLALAGIGAALLVGLLAWNLLSDDPDGEASSPSGAESSETGGQGADDGPGAAPSDAPAEPSAPEDEPTAEPAGSPEQFVSDYYALLPGDTGAAWELLSPQMRDEVGSLEDYEAFWATIDEVTVQDTASAGDEAVDVTLTYVSDGTEEQEVRRLELEPQDDGFVVVGDEVVG